MSLKNKIIAATPFVSLIIFLLCGYCWGLWHPGWVAFLLIPAVPVILGVKKIKHIYPVICVIAYLSMGFFADLWHPGWIIFLTIPIVSIFSHQTRVRVASDDEINRYL